MSQDVLERLWKRRAASLSRRLNFAWWLERFNALALGGLLLFASILLAVRTWRPEWIAPLAIGAVLAGLLAVLALAAHWLGSTMSVPRRA
jgi:peptidoglycan/LPS O-acetylase OafA/YrhL